MAYGKDILLKEKKGDDRFGYDLVIYDNFPDDYDWSYDHTITGQVYGYGPGGGNYDAEDWLRRQLDHEKLGIVFDSESGQFFAYSNEYNSLKMVVDALRWGYEQIAGAYEKVT